MNEKKGDIFGTNKHVFIEEIEPVYFNRNVKGKSYKLRVRRALFSCGLCGDVIKAQITAIKNNRILSCGCFRDAQTRDYHKRLKK